MQPKPKAVQAWMRQVDRYFEKTTFAYTCSNWAKRTANGRMIGYWPGSSIHQRLTLENPRFEDFEYRSFDEDEAEEDNSLAWIGNGMVEAQILNTSTTWYLDQVDIPPIPASMEDLKLTPPGTPGVEYVEMGKPGKLLIVEAKEIVASSVQI
jgi:hypothetical protein